MRATCGSIGVVEAKEEIRSRLNIEDVIGEYVQLKRAGRNFKGLSPFSQEKSPSFMVSPDKHIWHDFSSGKGGDVFSFVMEMEGVDFRQAMELLARKAGVDLTQFKKGDNSISKKKERLYEMYECASRFYLKQMLSNKEALYYVVERRGLKRRAIEEFGIGYSPDSFDALFIQLKSKGFDQKDVLDSGLVTRRRSGVGDMFRNRMMVSLADPQGRCIGFTARLISQTSSDAPKYINTPQTLLYDKGRHVFGLHLAKEAIRQKDYAVIVEGNMDVVSSHQAGIRNVVATAGTALTEYHLKALSRFTQDVRLAFDADKAGIAATERAIGLASNIGLTLGIISLPSGFKDPDEAIQADVKHWLQSIESPKDAIEWLLDVYSSQYDLGSAEGKRKVTDRILTIIKTIVDPVLAEHYIGVVAKRIQATTDALNKKLYQQARIERRVLKSNKANHTHLPDSIKTQDMLLALGLAHESVRDYMRTLEPQAFLDDSRQKIAAFLIHKSPLLQSDDIHVKIKQLQLLAEEYPTLDDKMYFNVALMVKRIKKEHKEKLRVFLSNKLFSELDGQKQKEINDHIKQLDKEIEALKR